MTQQTFNQNTCNIENKNKIQNNITMNNENDDLCVFQKIDNINISNAAFETTKGIEVYTC